MARTIKPSISGTGSETLYARILDDNTLEMKIGPKGRYMAHYTYCTAYKALRMARKFVADLNCADLKVTAYPTGYIPNRKNTPIVG